MSPAIHNQPKVKTGFVQVFVYNCFFAASFPLLSPFPAAALDGILLNY
jgi:hypothetical protein